VGPFERRGISRKIHQIYFGADLPERLDANVQELQRLNPDWAYTLYDDAAAQDFIKTHFGLNVLRAYNSLDPRYYAARADLLRYLIVYQEGGVYLDIKSRFQGPIDEFIHGDEEFILSQWRNGPGEVHEGFGLHPELAHISGGEFQNFHVIAAPGHPFLAAVIEAVLSNIKRYAPWHAVGRTGVLRVTGPIAYTKAIFPLVQAHPCKIVRHEGETGLQYSIAEAYQSNEPDVPHYSTVEAPVVQMSSIGELASRMFIKLRELKNAARQ
jgi:inositol phosphorylceramide mannosyltransferase catalytic subunit